MRKVIYLVAASFMILASCSGGVENAKTETVKVYGNCGMCKKTIEGALSDKEFIQEATWDVSSKELTVVYDEKQVQIDDIKQLVANVGYDSDSHRASDEIYSKLHSCCQYDRPE